MYDIERINSMIDDLNRFFKDLNSIGLNERNLNDPQKLHSSAMLLFAIINRTIDLAQEILVKNDLPMPSSYSECFPTLSKAGLLDKSLSSSLEKLAKQRGLFAHHYYDLDRKKVLSVFKEVSVSKTFVEKIKELIRKSKK